VNIKAKRHLEQSMQEEQIREALNTHWHALLASIDDKSLEICHRCRLWQRNSPATPKIPLLFSK